MKKAILPLLMTFYFLFAQDIYLSFGDYNPDEGSLEIWMENWVNVYSVQFTLTGFEVSDVVPGEIVFDSGNMLSFNSSGLILLFGFGLPIQPGEHLFCTIYFNEIISDQACFEDMYFSGWGGQMIENYEYDDCLSTSLCPLPGDVSGDNYVDILDVVQVVNCILYSSGGCSCADLNSDGTVDVSDLMLIVGMILEE